MSTDASREAFEAWYASPRPLERILDGSYRYMPAHTAWTAWQASRKQALSDAAKACASVCTPNLNSFGDGYNQAAIDCEKSIKELK